jgi:hypothetical protein
LARGYGARGDAETAGRILKWLVAHDLIGGYRTGGLEERFGRIDEYLATLPEMDRDAQRCRLLGYLEPTPLDPPVDAVEAARLERWAASRDHAALDRQVEALRKLVEADKSSPPRFRSLAAAIARCDATSGQFDQFLAMAEKALSLPEVARARPAVIDCEEVLPPASVLEDPFRYVQAVEEAITSGLVKGTLTRASATRSICLLGRWCAQNGLSDAAASLLRRAEAEAGALGGHWLWIGDLARSAGALEKAVEIETRLLGAETLPVVRVPALLDAVESGEGQDKADALAVQVAQYSDHPAVLRRAIALSRRHGDADALQAYQDRLKATSAATGPAGP